MINLYLIFNDKAKSMKHQLLLLTLILISNFLSFGQDVPNITPLSPTAYELDKYGQIPIGMFTGTPNVSVPLYEYKTTNLSVPISLSYNSNGIKVDQLSSNVGLGWSLNAGGVVTRIVRDITDEERKYFYPEKDIHTNGVTSPMAYDFFYAAGNNGVDTETDLFMYNMGHSGKFIVDNSGEIVLVPQKDLRVEGHNENIGGNIKKDLKLQVQTV